MTIAIRPIDASDARDVETLLDAAFGSDRHGRTAYRLRLGTEAIPAISFAAFDEGRLVASLQSWPVALTDRTGACHPLVLIGPIAVDPTLQRAGLGRRITSHALAAADRLAIPALVLIGDPEYYGRFFGFSTAATEEWQVPGPVERRRLLARLAPGVTLPRDGVLGPDLCTGGHDVLNRAHA